MIIIFWLGVFESIEPGRWRWFHFMIMIFYCGVFESIAEDCGFENKVLDNLKLWHVVGNYMEVDSERETCWNTDIFNSTNQLLRWCSILGIFWLWTPTGGSTRPRCLKSRRSRLLLRCSGATWRAQHHCDQRIWLGEPAMLLMAASLK